MKSPPHSTLHDVFAAQSPKAGKPVPDNWIAAFMEAVYELQRHQAMRVIGAYQRFYDLQSDGTEPAKVDAEESDADH